MEIGARLDNVYSMGTKINLKKVLTNNKKCDINKLNKIADGGESDVLCRIRNFAHKRKNDSMGNNYDYKK